MEYLQVIIVTKEQTWQVKLFHLSTNKSLGFEHTQSTEYQENGQVEHFNCNLKTMLAKLVKKVLFAYEQPFMSLQIILHIELILDNHQTFQ